MMKLLRRGSIGRGVLAFFATLALVLTLTIVAASVWVFLDRAWPLQTILFVALFSPLMLVFAAPIVLVLTFPLRFTALNRPLADVAIWALTFVALWLLVWAPTLNDFFDGIPLTASPILVAASLGSIAGWVYWLCAGRPAGAAR